MTTRKLMLAIAAGTALSLSACSAADSAGETEAGQEVSSSTLATLIGDNGDYSTVADTMKDAGLTEVFDGNAAYTVLLPSDQAFEALGENAQLLQGEEQRAAMVAVLRDHIFPGYFSPEDIGNAIDQADGGSVSMKSMGEHELTFTRSGDTITVTNSSDGSSAEVSGDAMMGSNGVAIPLNGVLKDFSDEAAESAA